jgi:Trk K+ transport system NAD-binding subunit
MRFTIVGYSRAGRRTASTLCGGDHEVAVVDVNFSACVVGETRNCRTVLRVAEDVSEPLHRRYTDIVDEAVDPE